MSTADQLLLARMHGVARRHAARAAIGAMAVAVAELREVAGARRDLLAEMAGMALGFAEAGLESLAPRYRAEAELAIVAGADEEQIPAWVEVGRKRAEQARLTPYTGVRYTH